MTCCCGLANARLLHPHWTDRIQREWMKNLAANRPDLTLHRIGRTQTLMERRFPDARVTGYRGIERSLPEIDPKDGTWPRQPFGRVRHIW